MTYLNNILRSVPLLAAAFLAVALSSCEKSESYSELLRDENKAVNWYLSTQKVENEIPADSTSFEVGPEAPFYRLDPDGYVYMQVISKGDPDQRVKTGDLVYFRFTRQNLKYLYNGIEAGDTGNSADVTSVSTSFVYQNQNLTSTTEWGTGIQMPLAFFGYNSEVNLVLRSYYGFSADQSSCYPYLINIRYFKPEY